MFGRLKKVIGYVDGLIAGPDYPGNHGNPVKNFKDRMTRISRIENKMEKPLDYPVNDISEIDRGFKAPDILERGRRPNMARWAGLIQSATDMGKYVSNSQIQCD